MNSNTWSQSKNIFTASSIRVGRWLACWSICATVALCISGCATLGRRATPPGAVAECRRLSQSGCEAHERGDLVQSEMLFRKAMETNPGDAEAPRNLAELKWRTGDREAAVQYMELAQQLAPHDPTLAVRSGQMWLELGDGRRARRWANQVIGQNTASADAWFVRGRAYFIDGDFQQALSDLHQAVRLNPNDKDILKTIALIHHRLDQPQRCLAATQRLLDLYPHGDAAQDALYIEGVALEKLGRNRDAAESLAAAVEHGAPRADIFHALATAQWRIGDAEAARATARRALTIDANHAPTVALLATIDASRAEPGVIRR